MTTDVNASCYGEYIARGKDDTKSYFYVTIGTGVGAGIVQGGKFLGLNNHPEMGHMLIKRYPEDNYEGKCPFHGADCVEGMAAGPSLEGRTGILMKSYLVTMKCLLMLHITWHKCSLMFI